VGGGTCTLILTARPRWLRAFLAFRYVDPSSLVYSFSTANVFCLHLSQPYGHECFALWAGACLAPLCIYIYHGDMKRESEVGNTWGYGTGRPEDRRAMTCNEDYELHGYWLFVDTIDCVIHPLHQQS
jgi:hypothetical protein